MPFPLGSVLAACIRVTGNSSQKSFLCIEGTATNRTQAILAQARMLATTRWTAVLCSSSHSALRCSPSHSSIELKKEKTEGRL
jgi:hypothetical protein